MSIKFDENYLQFSDFALCSALVALGYKLESLDRTEPQRVIFVFKRSKRLDLTIHKLWQRKLLVEPLAFVEAQKYLKARIYGEGQS